MSLVAYGVTDGKRKVIVTEQYPGRKIETPSMDVPSPPIQPRRPWWFWALLSGGGCLLLLVLLVGFVSCLAVLGSSGGDSVGQGSPSDAADSDELFTNDNYAELFSDPDAHRGEQVDVTGQLLERPENSGDELDFQTFADPENIEWNTAVYTGHTDLDLNTDDYVRVRGEVLGSFDGENAFGGGVTGPSIQASKVTGVSAGQAIDPAQEVREIDQTLGDQGFDVTLQKIEFGEASTRAYVVLTNGTGRDASFYTFDAKILARIDAGGLPGRLIRLLRRGASVGTEARCEDGGRPRF